MVERTFPQIDESLVTTIQGERHAESFSRTQNELFEHTSAEASQKLAQVELSQVFRYRPLILKVLLATLLVASLVGFAILQTEAFDFYFQRARLSNVPWPRNVQLTVMGFDEVDGNHGR